jgi:putative transposase
MSAVLRKPRLAKRNPDRIHSARKIAAEFFNRPVRYDWLAQALFDTIDDAQDQATRLMWHYNYERPNMALGGFTPNQRLAMAAQRYLRRPLKMAEVTVCFPATERKYIFRIF